MSTSWMADKLHGPNHPYLQRVPTSYMGRIIRTCNVCRQVTWAESSVPATCAGKLHGPNHPYLQRVPTSYMGRIIRTCNVCRQVTWPESSVPATCADKLHGPNHPYLQRVPTSYMGRIIRPDVGRYFDSPCSLHGGQLTQPSQGAPDVYFSLYQLLPCGERGAGVSVCSLSGRRRTCSKIRDV